MSDTVIKVENLSKQYRLGEVGTGTVSHDLNRWWYQIRGKDDPYLKIGEENIRNSKGKSDYVWALKDINFEIKQGEVLGIIGKNGAGKSTLLKILSRTTIPTIGSVKLKGRVASLLEVGTGFHPELSGRDNIFLNGAILGMSRFEIKSKFDEIVDFAGVERFIDTPVKRYSSGMYVRLAFAVAAHLDPEILIVDEVLAVGDAEFQKKALGKMQNVSTGQGRTVLFVSHNHQAIRQLCPKSILLKNGRVSMSGVTSNILQHYLSNDDQLVCEEWVLDNENLDLQIQNDYFFLTRILLTDQRGNPIRRHLNSDEEFIFIVFEGNVEKIDSNLCIGFVLRDENNNYLIINNHNDAFFQDTVHLHMGKNIVRIKLDISYLNAGTYYVDFNSSIWNNRMLHSADEVKISTKFTIDGLRGNPAYFRNKRNCISSPYLKWESIE